MKAADILDFINTFSPLCTAESWDNVGLLVGDGEDEVTGILTCLDITNKVVEEAVMKEANLIVSHHPVIFHPLKSVNKSDPVYSLIKNGICAICIHTNFDMTEGGVNDALIELLGLKSVGTLERVHANGLGLGAVCMSEFGFTAKGLAEHCKSALGLERVRYFDGDKHEIRRIGVCSGAGGDLLRAAHEAGCDALISGDIKHHEWIYARNIGMTLVDAGHYGTEICAASRIAALLSRHYGTGLPVFEAESDTRPYDFV